MVGRRRRHHRSTGDQRSTRDLLLAAGSLLPPEPWDNAVWTTLERATGCSGETLLAPLRLALTGEDSGPELADLLPLIGRPRPQAGW
jgi:glutamyl-tRNA synthetase